MCCSTCDGYEFVPATTNPDGPLMDCPDCRAIDARPERWCPVHSTRVEIDGTCAKCRAECVRAVGLMERGIAERREMVAA